MRASDCCKAILEISLPNANRYFKIMGNPERYKRSRIEISYRNGAIKASIYAKDPTALVASMGSLIKQISVINSVAKIAGNKKKEQ
ncbi:MAG: hypothetical protein ACP5T4_02275 [Candidatus Micrarchaeia archaeon]